MRTVSSYETVSRPDFLVPAPVQDGQRDALGGVDELGRLDVFEGVRDEQVARAVDDGRYALRI